MSLNAIPASPAGFGLTSTNSSISSTEEVPLGFAELLANQTLFTLSVDSYINPNPLNTKNLGNIEQEDTAFAEDSPQTDPAALGGVIGIPPITSNFAIDQTQRLSVDTPNNDKQPASIQEAILLDSKKGNSNSLDAPPSSAIPKNIFAEIEKQPPARNIEAANIAEQSSNSPSQTATFESVINRAAQAPTNSAQHLSISPAVTSHAWPKQFSEQIVWLAKNDQHSAQININPPQLGPLQITLNLNGDQMNAVFASPHAEVRQAIESALPQLRDMLSSAGISLGDTNVGANLARQNQETPFHSGNTTQSLGENAILPANDNAASTRPSQALLKGRGLVDLFA